MDYTEFNDIVKYYSDEPDFDYDSFREYYETQIGLKNRPRKPDVINNVSINSPYDIDLKEYRERWSKYELKHTKSLESFNDENRIKDFMYDRYGYLKKYSYLYDDRLFDTPIDLEIYIWCVDHDKDIEFHPKLNTDYKIDDEYITIKFRHMDSRLDQFDNEDTKYIFEDDPWIEEISQWMYDHYGDNYLRVFLIGIPFPWPNQNLRDTSPSGLIRYFHKSIYDAHYRGQLSTLEVWDDKNIFKKLAINRLKYVGDCTPIIMLHGLNIAKESIKVSVFKSTLADKLIEQYLYDAKNIFDPFSGFSGRMFGAINHGIPYIGSDVSEIHVKESNQILDFIKSNSEMRKRYPYANLASVHVANAVTSYGAYDCLLTCPPYATYDHNVLKNIEEWNNPNQEVFTCDQWIDICLNNFKCRKYVFVVDDTIVKYRNYIVGTVSNYGHIARNVEFIVFIDFTNYNNNYFNTNGSRGLTPYDIDKSKDYSESLGVGKTPFDI